MGGLTFVAGRETRTCDSAGGIDFGVALHVELSWLASGKVEEGGELGTWAAGFTFLGGIRTCAPAGGIDLDRS